MNYYKIGCRWDSNGKKGSNIESVFEKYQAIFIGTDRYYSLQTLKHAKINDRIAIADGKKIVGIAIIKSDQMTLKQMDIKEEEQMDFKQFTHQYYLNKAIGFLATVEIFDSSNKIFDARDRNVKYGNIGSFRKIKNSNVSLINYIDKMCKELI